MVDIGSVRLTDKLQRLTVGLDGTPRQTRRNLQGSIFLGSVAVVAQGKRTSHRQSLLLGLNPHIKVVFRESESFAIERERKKRSENHPYNHDELHGESCAAFFRRWRTTSYKTTPA